MSATEEKRSKAYRRLESSILWSWRLVSFIVLVPAMLAITFIGGDRGVYDAALFVFSAAIISYLLYLWDYDRSSKRFFAEWPKE